MQNASLHVCGHCPETIYGDSQLRVSLVAEIQHCGRLSESRFQVGLAGMGGGMRDQYVVKHFGRRGLLAPLSERSQPAPAVFFWFSIKKGLPVFPQLSTDIHR